MKKMIFVTNSFPFAINESSFIRPEIKELLKNFDITIVSRDVKSEQTTELPESVKVLRYDPRKNYNALALLVKTLFSTVIYKEFFRIVKKNKLSFTNIKKAVKYYMRSLHFASFLKHVRDETDESVVLYTYWNDYSVMSLSMIKRDGDRLVSRAHGADLYERRENGFFLPMKPFSNKKTDLIAFISDQGKAYFEKNYGTDAQKEVFRLGVGEHKMPKKAENGTLSVYSFSYITALKRVELIAEALAKIDGVNIKWTHIGSGAKENDVKETASRLLDHKSNITYIFTGAMENEDAMRFISESDFEVLINVSESEGLPVTMMEAMSFSIPVIATDVGGVSEIVTDGYNGFLIKSDENLTESLKETVLSFWEKTEEEKNRLRNNAYNTWNDKYNAQKNENKFTEKLMNL